MRKIHLFRTRLFGGYEKRDVVRYVLALEEELEKLEKENLELKERLKEKKAENPDEREADRTGGNI